MLLTALKMGRTSLVPETFLHSGFTSVKGKRGRVSSQRGEEAGIWVSGVRNENGRGLPSALFTGEYNEMGHLRRTVKMRNQN